MFFIIEIAFLIIGLWAMVKKNIPSDLIGGGDYSIEGPGVRTIGIVLVAPLLLSSLVGIILGLVGGNLEVYMVRYAFYVEPFLIILFGVISIILVRRLRRPLESPKRVPVSRAKRGCGYVLLGWGLLIAALGFISFPESSCGLVLSILAIYFGHIWIHSPVIERT